MKRLLRLQAYEFAKLEKHEDIDYAIAELYDIKQNEDLLAYRMKQTKKSMTDNFEKEIQQRTEVLKTKYREKIDKKSKSIQEQTVVIEELKASNEKLKVKNIR